MRRFELYRDVDISGTGVVAHGVRFDDDVTVIRWLGGTGSTVMWTRFNDAVSVYGHGGLTHFVWLDPEL